MSKVVDALHQKLHIEEKVALESSEDAHTDELFQRRMSSLHIFITTHYPESAKRKKMLADIQALKKLSHEALEHKE